MMTFGRTMAAVFAMLVVTAGCSAQQDSAQAPEDSTTTTAETTTSAPPEEPDGETAGDDQAAPATEVDLACPGLVSGTSQFEINVAGIAYDVRVFVPTSYTGSADEPAPVVINWHGLGSDGLQQAAYSGYEQLAETEGFLSVHPTGAPIPGTAENAWDLALISAEEMAAFGVDIGERDDLAMATELIDTLISDWCVDPGRVYSTGLSNGGFFTGRLICELGDRIAAAVAVAGITHPDDCDPAAAVPLLAYHGTDDTIVPYEGGESALAGADAPEAAALLSQTIAGEVEQFATSFGCDADPAVENPDTEITTYRYDGCDGDRFSVTLYEIAGGGHTWPGSPLGVALEPVLGPTTYQVDATADGWEFMSQFTR